MSTPDTIGAINRITTPFINHELAALMAAERQTTASTIGFSYGSLTDARAPKGDDNEESDDVDLPPTFEACSRAIITAAERMVTLTHAPRNLSVAIAFDECLDIVTAAVDHMEQIDLQGVLNENVTQAYQAMRSIRELLRQSPPVRRALQF